jgi:DNA helicase-2/ATP-dependent DNA helicase PcrA
VTAPGPPALGRGVVVDVGDPVPPPWREAPVVTVDGPAAIGALHEAWRARTPIVVALAIDPATYRAPQTTDAEPWTVDARFELAHDRLHFLTWANSYDARGGIEPVWWWSRKAARLGATASDSYDIVLPDGTHAWIDGGPRGPLEVAPVVHAETVDLGRLDVQPSPVAPGADLAPDQLAAVAHGAGPARIVAPAGSGKTRVLTERLRHLHVDRGVERELVLAVAYNKKAQLEMESRTTDFRPRVSTLNALGHRLLGAPRVLEEREVRRLLGDLVPTRQRRVNTDPMAPYLEGLTAIRLGLRAPEVVEAERDDVPGLAAAFGPYRAALARQGAVDFDEQVYGAIELLLRDGEARRRAQAGCRHLLVDELQDLAPAHVLLLRLLSSPAYDVFGVGDDDQVIYGHAGADPAFLIDFARLFPGAADHPLEVNYRCPAPVVDAARHLLSYNDRRVAKTLRAGPAADIAPDSVRVVLHAPDAGARTAVDFVQSWIDEGVATSDMAVLTRVNSLLLPPHVALVEAGIPVASTLPRDLLERTGVRAMLAYLRLGTNPSAMAPDDIVDVLRRPSRGLPQWFAKWLRGSMTVASVRAIADRLDDVKVIPKVQALADDLALVVAACDGGTTRRVLEVVRDDVGLGGAMQLLDVSKGGQTGSQLDDLDALLQVADLHPDPATFESWLRGVLARVTDEHGVTLSTVHRVKGMEWDRVVVAGVTGGVVPHRLADDVEEERRVLHVAITRCRHRVVVLGDASRPSPFLGELDGTASRRPVVVAKPTRPSTPARAGKDPAPLSPAATPVFEALRAWRLERSRADGVPAFVVAGDATLRAIAEQRPSSLRELSGVLGIGPTKLELYGDEILEVLEAV